MLLWNSSLFILNSYASQEKVSAILWPGRHSAIFARPFCALENWAHFKFRNRTRESWVVFTYKRKSFQRIRPNSHLASDWWMLSSFLPDTRILVNGKKKDHIFKRKVWKGKGVKEKMRGGKEKKRTAEEWRGIGSKKKSKRWYLKEFIFSTLFSCCLYSPLTANRWTVLI